MYTQLIEFASPQFDTAIRLRYLVLRQPLGMEFYPEDIAQEYDSHHLACYDDANQMIGILVLKPLGNDVLKMRQVAVSPNCQNQGVGSFLVKSAETLATRLGAKKFELHAREAAIAFYKRLNYNTVGDKFDEVGIPHYKMEKKLS